MYLSELTFLFSLGIYPRMELLDRTLSPVLVFQGSPILLPTVATPTYIPTSVCRVHFLHILARLLSVIFFMTGILTVVQFCPILFVCVCFYFYWDIVALQCRLSVCYTAQ